MLEMRMLRGWRRVASLSRGATRHAVACRTPTTAPQRIRPTAAAAAAADAAAAPVVARRTIVTATTARGTAKHSLQVLGRMPHAHALARSYATVWETTSGKKYELPEFESIEELQSNDNITVLLTGEPIQRSALFVDIEDIVRNIFSMKGDDVCVIQVDEARRSFADFVVVVTGKSPRHLRAMATALANMCNEALNLKSGRVRVEGLGDQFWTVVHTGNVAVHFMMPPARLYYNLEQLWAFGDEPEAGDATTETSGASAAVTQQQQQLKEEDGGHSGGRYRAADVTGHEVEEAAISDGDDVGRVPLRSAVPYGQEGGDDEVEMERKLTVEGEEQLQDMAGAADADDEDEYDVARGDADNQRPSTTTTSTNGGAGECSALPVVDGSGITEAVDTEALDDFGFDEDDVCLSAQAGQKQQQQQQEDKEAGAGGQGEEQQQQQQQQQQQRGGRGRRRRRGN